jgi:hypothetical protein
MPESVFGNMDPSLFLDDPTLDPSGGGKTPMLMALIKASRQAVGLPPLMSAEGGMAALQRMGGGQVEGPETVGALLGKMPGQGGAR